MRKVFNFSSGPAMLPEDVLLQAQAEMLDWHGTGMSIMELGHRGPEFQGMAEQCEADLRELMNIPDRYHVLFLTGGATAQFAMVPLNLLTKYGKADYLDTGIWSKKAITEARRYGTVHIGTAVTPKNGLASIPPQSEWNLSKEADYVHYTPNETIEGIQFKFIPETQGIPLVADMSSIILSEPIDVSRFGIIYAGAQKNMGQAGITIVIIRNDLIKEALPLTPTLYNYKIEAENKSFYNTPPTFAWYMSGLVFSWLKRQGGVEKMYEVNRRKAAKVYRMIDEHKEFYRNSVDPSCRSITNIPFTLLDDQLHALFLEEAKKAGLTNLKGHRVAGGLRASMYNSMPEAGADALVDFMRDFLKRRG